MMTRRFTATRVQLRHLHLPQLIVDSAAASVVAMLIMLILLLTALRAFDALAFESHLRYSSRDASVDAVSIDSENVDAAGTAGYEIIVHRASGALVVPPDQPDWVDSGGRDRTGAVEPVMWVYPDSAGVALSRLLAGNLIAGSIDRGTVLLDEASAAQLDVAPGSSLIVAGDEQQCTVVLGGIIRPFRDVDQDLADGLFVLPSSLCGPLPTTIGQDAVSLIGFNPDTEAATAISWSDRIASVIREVTDIRVTGLIIPVLLAGFVLWGLVITRASSRLRRALRPAGDLLIDLGCRPRTVHATQLLLITAIMTASAFLSSWGASRLLWHVAAMYIQTAQWVTTATVFSGVAIVVALVTLHRSHRRTHRRAGVRTGSNALTPTTAGITRTTTRDTPWGRS